jgi:hypothetical protein
MSHRGGGLPLAHLPFFTEGKKFRVPMYLATSFDEDVAYRLAALLMTACHDCSLTCCRFWYMAFDRGEPPVHWIIRVDPRGETSFRRALSARNACKLFAVMLWTQAPVQARELGGKDQR